MPRAVRFVEEGGIRQVTVLEQASYLIIALAAPYLLASGIHKVCVPGQFGSIICQSTKLGTIVGAHLARGIGAGEAAFAIIVSMSALAGGARLFFGEAVFLSVLTVAGAVILLSTGRCGCGMSHTKYGRKLPKLSWMVVRNVLIVCALGSISATRHNIGKRQILWIIGITQCATCMWILYNRFIRKEIARMTHSTQRYLTS